MIWKAPWYRRLRWGRVGWALWRLWFWLRYAVTADCGMACGYAEPYGFVPEAGCPVHDRYGW